MRSSTTRLLIVSFTLLIVVLTGIQLYWANKTYSFEQHNFHVSVIKSIRGIYEDIDMVDDPASRMEQLIAHPSGNTYVFRADKLPAGDSLIYYLKYEFDDFNVYTECELGIYDPQVRNYIFRDHLSFSGPGTAKSPALPVFKKSYGYICLHFPNRDQYILSRMNEWIVASILILVLLGGLSFSLYYFFREKFLNEMQKDFINNVTHEFSTPLAVIELSNDAIERAAGASEARMVKYTSAIRHQTEYLKKHIQALMKSLVAEHHPLQLDKEPVSINLLIRRAVAQLEPLIVEKNGKIILELEPDDTRVPADQENIYLAIFNLVNNALKYAACPNVLIKTAIRGGAYHVTVEDNGVGISSKDIRYIFRKFYRARDGDPHQVKGLGLGLYFTRKVVAMHNGHVHARSVPGEGSTFVVELPVY